MSALRASELAKGLSVWILNRLVIGNGISDHNRLSRFGVVFLDDMIENVLSEDRWVCAWAFRHNPILARPGIAVKKVWNRATQL